MTAPTPPDSPVTEPLKQTATYSLDEIEQMLSAVTPGPWRTATHFDAHAQVADCGHGEDGYLRAVHAKLVMPRDCEYNARFIAASPTIARDLLDGYRALSAEREALSARVAELEADARRIDAIERGEIEIDFMGTTTRYFNVYRPDGDLSTTADGTSLRAAFDHVLNPAASR